LSTFEIFERPEQAAKLGTTAFGGQLFDPKSLGPLGACSLSNAALFHALDRLCSFDDPKTRQRLPVNFGALATEEFGSVYESLLELHPVIETAPLPCFAFKQTAGNDRKTSGSFYTPTTLVDCLLDSALDPVLDDHIRNHKALGYPSAEAAILSLKVCDPACGSGHFLIAAAQRTARRLAQLRAGDDEPAPDQLRHALREVISHCIYAVDINPMSVELCRVALWLEAVEPGKPLSFLDHHLRVGNSLLGATPELVAEGLPDDAFTAIEGDDKKACSLLKKRNKASALVSADYSPSRTPRPKPTCSRPPPRWRSCPTTGLRTSVPRSWPSAITNKLTNTAKRSNSLIPGAPPLSSASTSASPASSAASRVSPGAAQQPRRPPGLRA